MNNEKLNSEKLIQAQREVLSLMSRALLTNAAVSIQDSVATVTTDPDMEFTATTALVTREVTQALRNFVDDPSLTVKFMVQKREEPSAS